ncbi:MAG: hypothetical protein JWN09_228 [Microbacteriaceae bacterium]|jgi:signal transduction histidine kinase|nr:hypothetical protein [Microbacteriaceae bacterium]
MRAGRPAELVRHSGIRARVTLATAIVVTATLVIAGVALVLLLQQLLVAGLDSTQLTRANDLSAQFRSGALGSVVPGTTTDSSLVQVVDSSGAVVASTANVTGEAPVLPHPPSQRQTTTTTITDSPLDTGTAFRIVAEPVTLQSGPGWIYVAASLGQVDSAVTQLRTLFIIGLPVVVSVVAVIAWLAVRQSLGPVENIRRRAAAINASDLSQRVPVPPGTDEIALLATTMNDMLSRIEMAATRQRQFVGDASHELRSPLAALQIQLDLALRQTGGDEISAELAPMRDQVKRMTMLIDDLLFLARSTEPTPMVVPSRVDLDELVFAEAQRLRELGGPSISVSVHNAARVRGSFRDLTRMLRNLGDNAYDHAKSMVTITLAIDGHAARLVVSDDGPGIAEADREQIFARFSRLDDSRMRDTRGGGSGLGLSIARQIVESTGGTIAVRDRADGRGGAEFVVSVPVEDSEL